MCKITKLQIIGKLNPRYTFALNPYLDARFTRCPKCGKPTYYRKFALLIHLKDYGPIVLGKTCPYCTKCEFIIAHKDKLEEELKRMTPTLIKEINSESYSVMGTVNIKTWKRGLLTPLPLEKILEDAADFKSYVKLQPKIVNAHPSLNKLL